MLTVAEVAGLSGGSVSEITTGSTRKLVGSGVDHAEPLDRHLRAVRQKRRAHAHAIALIRPVAHDRDRQVHIGRVHAA